MLIIEIEQAFGVAFERDPIAQVGLVPDYLLPANPETLPKVCAPVIIEVIGLEIEV